MVWMVKRGVMRPWWLSLVAYATVLLSQPAVAQGLHNDHPSAEPVLSHTLQDGEQTRSSEGGRASLAFAPPLPFKAPQVGPVIKRAYSDDVDKRTTAFIPQRGALAGLTPIELPEDEARWIRVDLSEQLVIAYEADKPVRAFVISSGLPGTPTITGTFRIRAKVREQTMSGIDYHLPGVEWVQYFFEDYGFHGTYWHNNFGRPMSRGCVNMTNADAKWLFDWAGPVWDGETIWFKSTQKNPGTLVVITE